ncbi:MAG: dihydroorotase [Thermotogae bacterium]|nr:dihydroorotase [Thermotogota bacterium]
MGETPADILVEEGKIKKIGNVSEGADEVIDIQGRFVLPGLVDPHAHAREPGQEHKETLDSLSEAAVRGGYTHVAVMPNTSPPIDTPELVRSILRRAEGLAVHIHVIGALTKGRKGGELVEVGLMKEAGVIALSDDGDWVTDASVMFNALTYAAYFNLPIITHAEVPELAGGFAHYDPITLKYGMKFRLSLAEELAVYRDGRLAQIAEAHLHVAHVSAAETLEIIRSLKNKGVKITAEVTPHHLLFSTERIPLHDPLFRVNPPIRSEKDRLALIDALKEGIIDFVATDHAPHSLYEKEAPISEAAAGIEGLETAFSALFTHLVKTGEISLKDLVRWMATEPGHFMGVSTAIEVGKEANLVVFDQDARWVPSEKDLASAGKNNPFLGKELCGRVILTFAKGKPVYQRR